MAYLNNQGTALYYINVCHAVCHDLASSFEFRQFDGMDPRDLARRSSNLSPSYSIFSRECEIIQWCSSNVPPLSRVIGLGRSSASSPV